MMALVKEGPGPGLTLMERPLPEPGPHEVRIRVLKTAICGTDMHIWDWDAWSERTLRPPLITGHEFVGQVDRCGSDVSGFEEGMLVSGEGHIICGACRNCRAGRRHLCKHTIGVGVQRDGAFAEYLVLPAMNVVALPDDLDLEVAACLDPLGNAVHTALKYPLTGEDVLITGAGPIGIMVAAIARHCGAKHIVLTDLLDARLELASFIPRISTLNVSRDALDARMAELGMVEGFDIGLELSGSEQAFASMIDHMNTGGKVALLGIHSGDTRINWDHVVFNGLTITGIYGREMFETWYLMISMLQTGLDIKPLITHRFDYRDYEEAFAVMGSRRSGKVVLNWSERR